MLDHTGVLHPDLVFEHHFVRAHQESNRIPNTLGFDPTTLGFSSSVTTGPAIDDLSRHPVRKPPERAGTAVWP